MPTKIEIERKFLVDVKKFKQFIKDAPSFVFGEHYLEQGYLTEYNARASLVRVRLDFDQHLDAEAAYLTVKTAGLQKRKETEIELSAEAARELLGICVYALYKKRYLIDYGNRVWEVDVFDGALDGLCMAELENQTLPKSSARLPPWLGKEVTKDRRYTNICLAKDGLP